MAFPLKDVRYSTRRARGEDAAGGAEVAETRALYPRLLRDRAVLPKVEIAVQYFESLVGRERREMDAEVLVQFFGDHKLARCVVAALATSYRYRSPTFADVCSRTALRRLERAGAPTSIKLRAYLYDRLNGARGSGDGFLRRSEQAATYGTLERSFALRAGLAERLLYLDADEHAVLTRTGPVPQPADVVAQYNFGVLETLLRHAQAIELTLSDGAGAGGASRAVAGLRALAAANDVDLGAVSTTAGTAQVRLAGRADAMGSWARYGRRIARTVVQLLERARRTVTDGTAVVLLRERRAVLRLTPEVLDLLGGGDAPDAGWDDLPGWDSLAVVAGLAAARVTLARRKGGGGKESSAASGWGLRRLPEAQAWAAGMVVPDVRLVPGGAGAGRGTGGGVSGAEGAVRLCAVRSARHGERLAVVGRGARSGEALLFFGPPPAVAPLLAAGLPAVTAPEVDLAPVLDALDRPAAPPGALAGTS